MLVKFTLDTRKPSKSINCPNCNEIIEFYHYSGMGDLAPHFYCDLCSNILFREKDRMILDTNEPTKDILHEIIKDLPKCICGGQFKAGANPKCPHCKKEIEHQTNQIQRLNDPYIIQVKGAYLLRPKDNNS